MENTIVIYKSKYGSTKKYAQWIAEELECDLFESTQIKKGKLKDYRTIIFGGGLYASGINGIKLITENYDEIKDKNILLFTVGLSSTQDKSIFKPILEKNLTKEMQENINVFHLRGGIDYKKLGLLHKIMMFMLKQRVLKKNIKERTLDDEGILKTYGKKVDFTDKKSIEPIISHTLRTS